ncbi:Bdr family repetitive protein [Borrelia duttonii]
MLHSQAVITQEMVLSELVKAGINRDIATDLSYRYYKNELTAKDLEYLKENFDIKLKMLERSLKAEIISVKTEFDNKIDTKFTELDNKINTIEINLNAKIDKVRDELKLDIKELDNKVDTKFSELDNNIELVRKDIEIE